jgi:Fuc2NAc and GlcNAc transferase
LHKEKIWQAHKLHAYQRLHQAGYSHLQVLCVIILLNMVLALLALFATAHSQWLPESIVVALVVYLFFYAFVEYMKPMYEQGKEAVSR